MEIPSKKTPANSQQFSFQHINLFPPNRSSKISHKFINLNTISLLEPSNDRKKRKNIRKKPIPIKDFVISSILSMSKTPTNIRPKNIRFSTLKNQFFQSLYCIWNKYIANEIIKMTRATTFNRKPIFYKLLLRLVVLVKISKETSFFAESLRNFFFLLIWVLFYEWKSLVK